MNLKIMHTVYTLRPVGPCRAGDRAPIRLARRWQSSAHTYPTKPQELMARTGSLPHSPWWAPDGSQEGGSLWLLGEGWPGRSLQHPREAGLLPTLGSLPFYSLASLSSAQLLMQLFASFLPALPLCLPTLLFSPLPLSFSASVCLLFPRSSPHSTPPPHLPSLFKSIPKPEE